MNKTVAIETPFCDKIAATNAPLASSPRVDFKAKRTLLEKITQSWYWKALKESSRRRAEIALKFGYYY